MEGCEEGTDYVMAELTPVTLGDNTSVKIPYAGAPDVTHRAMDGDPITSNNGAYDWFGDANTQGSYRCESGQPLSSGTSSPNASLICLGEDPENSTEVRTNRLLNLFRGLPRDMFVNKLISVYNYSEVTLEDIRLELFEYTKAFEEFPYGPNVELKKRIHTRNGESVVTKLSKDIHVLLSVIEGAEFTELTEVMSVSRPTKTRSSQSVTQSCSPHQCACSAEINVLKHELGQLKADILLLKQKNTAIEMRAEQVTTLKTSVQNISTDVRRMNEFLHTHSNELQLAVTRLGNERSLGITSLRNDLKLLSEKVKSIDDQIDMPQYTGAENR